MTAWRLGEDAVGDSFRTADTQKDALTFVGKMLDWIPADVVALFAAAITAFQSNPSKNSAKILIIGGVLLTFVAVLGGAYKASRSFSFAKAVWTHATLAPIAFLIWSPSVPNSGWHDINWIDKNPELTVAACAVAAFLFALFAPDKPTG